jgi:Chlamydia polymorphic membrane protein (Chlamydia_PMP) repeat
MHACMPCLLTTMAAFLIYPQQQSKHNTQLGGTTEVENGATGLAFGTVFSDNQAFSGGGAMRVLGQGSTLVATNSVFNANAPSRSGGALHIQNEDATSGARKLLVFITKCLFSGNASTSRSGGAIWSNRNAVIKITDSQFTLNSAAEQGGALFIGGDSFLISQGNVFESNAIVPAPPGNPLTGGNHIFINDINNYDSCATDTFVDPDAQDSTAVVTSSGPFFCEFSEGGVV